MFVVVFVCLVYFLFVLFVYGWGFLCKYLHCGQIDAILSPLYGTKHSQTHWHTHAQGQVHTCKHKHTHTQTNIRLTHTHIHTQTHTYTDKHQTHTQTHTYTDKHQTHTHTHIHTQTHTHTYTKSITINEQQGVFSNKNISTVIITVKPWLTPKCV